jgi:hypothetical protein
VVFEVLPTDDQGNAEQPAVGEVVLSVASPEALRRQADELGRLIDDSDPGTEPLVVLVEAAEELREDEVTALLDAARRSARPVIVRVIRGA